MIRALWRTRLVAGCSLAMISAAAAAAEPAGPAKRLPWMNASLAAEQRSKLLLEAMTLDEKIQQMVGAPGVVPEIPHCYGARHQPGISRLGIPTFRITNGPVGVGQNDCVPAETVTKPTSALMSPHSAKATALPSDYKVMIGTSSRDLLHTATVQMPAGTTSERRR